MFKYIFILFPQTSDYLAGCLILCYPLIWYQHLLLFFLCPVYHDVSTQLLEKFSKESSRKKGQRTGVKVSSSVQLLSVCLTTSSQTLNPHRGPFVPIQSCHDKIGLCTAESRPAKYPVLIRSRSQYYFENLLHRDMIVQYRGIALPTLWTVNPFQTCVTPPATPTLSTARCLRCGHMQVDGKVGGSLLELL